MAIIPDRERDDLKREFRKDLKKDVTIRLFTQGSSALTVPGRGNCQYCSQTQELMEELTGLSPKLHLEIYDFHSQHEERDKYGVEQIPAIVMGDDDNARIKFYGIPMGYEFPVILENIKTLSRGVSPLTMDSRKKLRKVNQAVHIRVFVTPSWGFCPSVARLAHAFAIESPLITADIVEASEFPALSQTYAVRGVPKTVITPVSQSQIAGGIPGVQFVGAVPEQEFVEKVLEVGIKEAGTAGASP